MSKFVRDGFAFFDGFFGEPVFILEGKEIEKEVSYILTNKIKCVSLTKILEDFSFLSKIPFLEEVYLSRNIDNQWICSLKEIRRLVVNIEKGEPDLDYSEFPKLEVLSMDWYSRFPDLSNNETLRKLSIWKYKPKSKSLSELSLPKGLEHLHITESNISNLEGLEGLNLKIFEAHYCKSLESIEGVKSWREPLETLILDYCKKLSNYEELSYCKNLSKIILGDCGDIPTLKWLIPLKNVKYFSFWGTKLIDGDTSPCSGIDFVNFKNLKHYNNKKEVFNT